MLLIWQGILGQKNTEKDSRTENLTTELIKK